MSSLWDCCELSVRLQLSQLGSLLWYASSGSYVCMFSQTVGLLTFAYTMSHSSSNSMLIVLLVIGGWMAGVYVTLLLLRFTDIKEPQNEMKCTFDRRLKVCSLGWSLKHPKMFFSKFLLSYPSKMFYQWKKSFNRSFRDESWYLEVAQSQWKSGITAIFVLKML